MGQAMDSDLVFQVPDKCTGNAVHRLVGECPPLDTNSMYCNLLQCSHFAETSVAVTENGELKGFVSGYVLPGRPDTLFIWQVAVSGSVRGRGVAGRMLDHILERESCAAIRYLETTITEDNAASWGLFRRFAEQRNAELKHSVMFDEQRHFAGQHASELLVKIGPFTPLRQAGQAA